MQKDLRQLWKQTDKAAAAAHPEDWIARTEASGIPTLQKFAKTLAVNGFGIWADNDYPFSTGLPSRAPKTRSKPWSDNPLTLGITNGSAPKSWSFTKPGTLQSDEPDFSSRRAAGERMKRSRGNWD